jgi:hypothetical protein
MTSLELNGRIVKKCDNYVGEKEAVRNGGRAKRDGLRQGSKNMYPLLLVLPLT